MDAFTVRITVMKWLPLALIIVGCIGFAYLGLQQMERQGMNDPQVQMAEDAALALANGAAPASVVPQGAAVDPAQSLSPFIGVFDSNGTVIVSNASLHGMTPTPPAGVFNAALQKGQNRVTWQPEGSVRIALVVVPVPNSSGWYVAAGRSMREGEIRIDQLTWLAMLAMAFLLSTTLALELFGAWRHSQAMAKQHQQH